MDSHFSKYDKMLHHAAWRLSKSTPNIDISELYSEACSIYVAAAKSYNKERGSFSKYLHTMLTSRLPLYLRTLSRSLCCSFERSTPLGSMDEHAFRRLDKGHLSFIFRDTMESASPDVRTVWKLLNEDADRLTALMPDETYGSLISAVEQLTGWPRQRRIIAFNEIVKTLRRVEHDRV